MTGGVRYCDPPSARTKTSLYAHVALASAGDLAFIAGQVSPRAGDRENEFSLQVREAFAEIGGILESLGAGFDDVAEFTTYLVDPDHIGAFREVRNALFPELFRGPGYPPNTLLVVQRLGEPEWLIEVKTVARLPE